MFSGFSNQVTSWMGAVKGEPHDEEVPTPTPQQGVEPPAAIQPEPQSSSQTLEDVPITINEGEEGVNVQRFVKFIFLMYLVRLSTRIYYYLITSTYM